MRVIVILQELYEVDEVANNADVTYDDNAPLFRYKAGLITNTEADGTRNRVKIAVPLKYFSNFWRSLKMPLINCNWAFFKGDW